MLTMEIQYDSASMVVTGLAHSTLQPITKSMRSQLHIHCIGFIWSNGWIHFQKILKQFNLAIKQQQQQHHHQKCTTVQEIQLIQAPRKLLSPITSSLEKKENIDWIMNCSKKNLHWINRKLFSSLHFVPNKELKTHRRGY